MDEYVSEWVHDYANEMTKMKRTTMMLVVVARDRDHRSE